VVCIKKTLIKLSKIAITLFLITLIIMVIDTGVMLSNVSPSWFGLSGITPSLLIYMIIPFLLSVGLGEVLAIILLKLDKGLTILTSFFAGLVLFSISIYRYRELNFNIVHLILFLNVFVSAATGWFAYFLVHKTRIKRVKNEEGN